MHTYVRTYICTCVRVLSSLFRLREMAVRMTSNVLTTAYTIEVLAQGAGGVI